MDESYAQLVEEVQALRQQVAELAPLVAEYKRAEGALRESEERYRRLLESVTDYVYTVKVEDGRAVGTTHGPGCVAVTGYTSEEYAAEPYLWHRMVYDEDKAAVTAQAERVLAGRAEPLEHRIVHKDGSIRWVRNTPVPRCDAGGRLVGYDGLIADITGRKRAEEALRESEEKYRTVVEASTDAIFLETLEGRVLDCNTAACQMYACARADLLRLTMADLVPAHLASTLPDTITQELAGGQAIFVEAYGRRRTGEVFPCEINTCFITIGGEARVIVYVHDLAERRAAEEARLREKEIETRARTAEAARLELEKEVAERVRVEEALRHRNEELMARNAIATMIGQSRDLDHILDAILEIVLEVVGIDAGWIQLVSQGLGANQLRLAAQRGFSEAMAEELETVELGHGLTGQVAQAGQPVVVADVSQDPCLCVVCAGQEGLRGFAAVPIKSKESVLGVLGVFSRSPRELGAHDIQLLMAVGHQIGVAIENVRLAEQAAEIEVLRELDRLRSELLANISHELRTPLGLIEVFCTTLLRQDVAFDLETQREFLGDIQEETGKLEELVDNLLDLARIQAGGFRLDLCPVDVSQLARQAITTLDMQLSQLGREPAGCTYRFVHDFPPGGLVALADPRCVEQVLRNLLSNAVKYSPQGGTITVQGRHEKGQLVIRVSDQGIGIPARDLEKIFERFYRVENDVTQSVRGAGLGLPVCQGIVEAHGGRIWAESALGAGSTFCFTLQPVEGDD